MGDGGMDSDRLEGESMLGMSPRTQLYVVRGMQLLLAGVAAAGIYTGKMGVFVNGVSTLAVSFLPGVLKRDYKITIHPGLMLWVTAAVFLHAVGALGPYKTVWWWDHVTHMLSASLTAGIGYIVARGLELHSPKVRIPNRFMFVFILLFAMAAGVIWEIFEFYASTLSQDLLGQKVVTVYGLGDTMEDLLFDLMGGILVALWGTIYLTDVAGGVSNYLDGAWGRGSNND
ncbi:MAG: hypothetical protein ABEK59_02415 [Halobacteria archaeon]